MIPRRSTLVLLSFLLALATRAFARPIDDSPSDHVSPAIAARLSALAPDHPGAYMDLADEIADASGGESALARTLYVLAFRLQPGMASNAVGTPLDAAPLLGLAAIERRDATRRWLLALARSVDSRYTQFDWSVSTGLAVSEELAYKAASVLGLARSGEGREARRLLAEPGVRELLKRYERAIGDEGQPGFVSALEQTIAIWPCPECGNARVITKPGPKGPEVRLCPTCRGNPGPILTREELLNQLRFESILLNGIQRSWIAQSLIDQSAPLRDPDPADLPALYSVDATRPYWRNGQWVATPDDAAERPRAAPSPPPRGTNTVPASRPEPAPK
jgi:hypothetical protein